MCLQLLGKRTRSVGGPELEAPPDPLTNSSSEPGCYQPRPPARNYATKPAVKTVRGRPDSKRICPSTTNDHHVANTDTFGALHAAVLELAAADQKKRAGADLMVVKQQHLLILEQAKDAVAAAGGPAAPIGRARPAGATPAAVIAWPSDSALWQLPHLAVAGWSGESAVFFFSRTSTVEGDSTTRHVIAKRYHHAACCVHERAVFNHLAAAFSATELRLYVRTRLSDQMRPQLTMLDQLQSIYASSFYSERGRTTYQFSDDPLPPNLQGAHSSKFVARLKVQPLPVEERRAAIIKRLEWFHRYDRTMNEAIASVRVQEDDPPTPAVPKAIGNLANLRSNFFWRQTNDGRSSWQNMEQWSDRLVLHLFQCLTAHHRASVLMGDIKPGNMFVNCVDLLPVFGDYGHATVFDKSGSRAVHGGRITPDTSAHTRVIYRELSTANLSPALTKIVNELAPLPSATKTALRLKLAGTCSSIGTYAYRALESLPATGHSTGIYTQRSDWYSLAASLIEILAGYTCQVSSQHREREAKSMRRLRRLRMQCDQLANFSSSLQANPCDKQQWLSQGAPAWVSQPLIQLLRQLIEPPCHFVRVKI